MRCIALFWVLLETGPDFHLSRALRQDPHHVRIVTASIEPRRGLMRQGMQGHGGDKTAAAEESEHVRVVAA